MIKNITKVKWAPIRQLPIYYLPMHGWMMTKAGSCSKPYASLSDSRRLSFCYLIVSKILSLQLRETGFMNAEKLCLWNPESGKYCLWNLESWALEPGIQLKEPRIPPTIRIRNPSSTDKDWNLIPGIRNPRRGVQNPRLSWIPLNGANFCFNAKRSFPLKTM